MVGVAVRDAAAVVVVVVVVVAVVVVVVVVVVADALMSMAVCSFTLSGPGSSR